jgi:hypothetical protein
MTDKATPEGAEVLNQTPAQQPQESQPAPQDRQGKSRTSPRSELTKEIAAKVKASRTGETIEPEVQEPTPEIPEVPENEEARLDGAEEGDKNATPALENSDEEFVTVKIDGKIQQVPRSKVLEVGVRSLQKELAADARLNEAARIHRELEQKSKEILLEKEELRKLASSLQEQYNKHNSGPSKDVSEFREAAKQILNAVYHDDQEAAEVALASALAGRTQSAATPNEESIKQAARAEALKALEEERKREAHRKAVQAFLDDNAHIAKDPRLFKMTDEETVRVHQEHPEWSTPQVLAEAGRRVTEWARQFRGAPSTHQASDRKRNLAEMPSPASVRHSPPPAKEPLTPSERIRQMRLSRGQPV